MRSDNFSTVGGSSNSSAGPAAAPNSTAAANAALNSAYPISTVIASRSACDRRRCP